MAERPRLARVRRVLAATDGRLDHLVEVALRWVRTHRAPWWLVDLLFVAAAVADAVLDISGATTVDTVLSLLAAAGAFLTPDARIKLVLGGLALGLLAEQFWFYVATFMRASGLLWHFAWYELVHATSLSPLQNKPGDGCHDADREKNPVQRHGSPA